MVIVKTPAELPAGIVSDTSVVHSSQNDNKNNSKKHTERDISRLQSSIVPYAQKTYNIGDLVLENNFTFRCIIAITIPEVFTEAKWIRIGGALGFFARSFGGGPNNDWGNNQFATVSGGNGNPAGSFFTRCTIVPVDCNLDQYTISINTNALTDPATVEMILGDDKGNVIGTLSADITIPNDMSTGIFFDRDSVDFVEAGQTIAWKLTTASLPNNDITLLSTSCRITEP